MKTLSTALNTILGYPVTRPAWLIEINWSTPSRISSFNTIDFNGYTWQATDINISGISYNGYSVTGQIKLQNTDNGFGSLILTEGIADKQIKIYGFDAGAISSEDFVYLISCVGGKASISNSHVSIDVRSSDAYVYGPRSLVNRYSGFTYLLPAGALINVNGTIYQLERR